VRGDCDTNDSTDDRKQFSSTTTVQSIRKSKILFGEKFSKEQKQKRRHVELSYRTLFLYDPFFNLSLSSFFLCIYVRVFSKKPTRTRSKPKVDIVRLFFCSCENNRNNIVSYTSADCLVYLYRSAISQFFRRQYRVTSEKRIMSDDYIFQKYLLAGKYSAGLSAEKSLHKESGWFVGSTLQTLLFLTVHTFCYFFLRLLLQTSW
jgi:hypothetical protein